MDDVTFEYTFLTMETSVKLGTPINQFYYRIMDDVSHRYGVDYSASPNNVNYGTDICGPRIYTLGGDYVDGTTTPWLTMNTGSGLLQI